MTWTAANWQMSEAEREWIASRIADLIIDFINTSADERADEIRGLLASVRQDEGQG